MDTAEALDLGREALLLVLIISAPVMVIGLVTGLAISIFQAVTQLNEQTLVFIPKILAMALAAILFVPWITARMIEFTQELLGTPLG
jgi:flagellar biosynthetic protein FliQ